MPSASSTDELPRRLRRRPFGYRRKDVDLTLAVMEEQLMELRNELLEKGAELDEVQGVLGRARQELRYWEDRSSFVDGEVERARGVADRIEREARERADAVEKDAKERSLRMIDRVCKEANALIQHARDEAREVAARYQEDVALAERRVHQLRQIQTELRASLRAAVQTVESSVQDVDAPAADVPEPATFTVRALQGAHTPNFGRSKAVEAAQRFGSMPKVLPGLERETEANSAS